MVLELVVDDAFISNPSFRQQIHLLCYSSGRVMEEILSNDGRMAAGGRPSNNQSLEVLGQNQSLATIPMAIRPPPI